LIKKLNLKAKIGRRQFAAVAVKRTH